MSQMVTVQWKIGISIGEGHQAETAAISFFKMLLLFNHILVFSNQKPCLLGLRSVDSLKLFGFL